MLRLNDIHAVEALPFIQFHGLNVTFMHDNARLHSAAITKQFFVTNNVNVLDWPANNPIEHVWDELGRPVRRNHTIHTVNDLSAALQAEWVNLPAPFIQRYVNRMRHSGHCTKWWTHEILTHFIESSVSFCWLKPPLNEFKPILLCNCVLQNYV